GPATGAETGDHDRVDSSSDDVGGDAARHPAAAPMAVSRPPRPRTLSVMTEPDEPIPSLYEWAGGEPAIRRLMDCFYDRVERDDLLGPRFFPDGVGEDHRAHVSAWWSEVLGGPARYTEELGGYEGMLAHHRG